MRDFDEAGLQRCKFQARLFELSASRTHGSSSVFIRSFMNSRFSALLDSDSFVFSDYDSEKIISEMSRSYKLDRGNGKYSAEELYWIGYLYRYWCYVYLLSSRSVYAIVKPEELRSLYLPYHSLDPDSAIRRICEVKGIEPERSIVDSLRKAHSYT